MIGDGQRRYSIGDDNTSQNFAQCSVSFSSFFLLFFLLFGRTNPTLTPQAHFRKQAHPTKVRVKYFMGTLTVRILWACFWCLRATSSHILSRTPQPSCSLTSRARTNGMSASRPPISRLRETISWDSPLPQEMLQVCVLPSAAILQFPIALHLFELDNHDIIRVTTYMISLVSSIPRRVLNRIHFFFFSACFFLLVFPTDYAGARRAQTHYGEYPSREGATRRCQKPICPHQHPYAPIIFRASRLV